MCSLEFLQKKDLYLCITQLMLTSISQVSAYEEGFHPHLGCTCAGFLEPKLAREPIISSPLLFRVLMSQASCLP